MQGFEVFDKDIIEFYIECGGKLLEGFEFRSDMV